MNQRNWYFNHRLAEESVYINFILRCVLYTKYHIFICRPFYISSCYILHFNFFCFLYWLKIRVRQKSLYCAVHFAGIWWKNFNGNHFIIRIFSKHEILNLMNSTLCVQQTIEIVSLGLHSPSHPKALILTIK